MNLSGCTPFSKGHSYMLPQRSIISNDGKLEQIEDKLTHEEDQKIIKKILIAIDESDHKVKILSYGLILAKSLGAAVTAVHVIDRSSLGALQTLGGLLGYYEEGSRGFEQELKKHAKELLGKAEALANRDGVKMNTEVIINASSVAEGIINYASSTNMDFIVIGTKGMTGAKKFLLGSVTNNVISHAHCPVLAVR
jgi:nucleotide-binding universal stress UspA family protein